MKKVLLISVFLAFFAGCHTDIVTTRHLKAINPKCVHIASIESEDPYVGKVIQGVLEKEFIRKKVQLCDPNSATIILTGSTFLTTRSTGKKDWFGSKESSSEAIESLTITASKLTQEFGSVLANKLK